MRHHERALTAFIERELQRGSLGVVLVGSVARGTERAGSDVDVYLLVSDDEFDAAIATPRVSYVVRDGVDGVDYPGGYIDVKLATLAYLTTAAERADDPTRASFVGARAVAPSVPQMDALLERIVHPPEQLWQANADSFMAQVYLYGEYFLPHGERVGDRFLLNHAVTHLALAAARAMLARNRVLFRGPKYVTESVRALEHAPTGFTDAIDSVLEYPSATHAAALIALLEDAGGWGIDRSGALSRFIYDNELGWLRGHLPAEFR